MSSTALAVGLGALGVIAILLLDLPVQAWHTRTRYLLVAFVVVALTITMTAATSLIVDAGPLQIWSLPQGPDTL